MKNEMPVASPAAAAGNPREEVTLAGGECLTIRAVRSGDRQLERHFIEALSPASRRFRFLETIRTPTDALLEQLTVLDPSTDAAFVAVIGQGEEEKAVGVGRFSADADGQDCEFALTVADEWQGKGLGSLLMGRLMDVARARGIARMHSSDAAENQPMREFARHLRLRHRIDPDDATMVIYSVELTPSRGLSIELAQDGACHDWCRSLGCTENELKAAIATVGHEAREVRAFVTASHHRRE